MGIVGERLRASRRKARISQQKLAAKVGVDRRTIGRWESGEQTPDPGTLFKCAGVLNTASFYLMGLRDQPDRAEFPAGDERELLGLYRALDPQGRREALDTLKEAALLMGRLRPRRVKP